MTTPIVLSFIDALGQGRYEDAFAIVAQQGVIHQPGTDQPLPLHAWRGAYEGLMANRFTAPCTYTVHTVTEQDDRVSVICESYGELTAGGVYNNHYHWLFVVRNGLISELYEFMDTLYAQQTFRPSG